MSGGIVSRLILALYNFFLLLFAPLIFLHSWWRSKINDKIEIDRRNDHLRDRNDYSILINNEIEKILFHTQSLDDMLDVFNVNEGIKNTLKAANIDKTIIDKSIDLIKKIVISDDIKPSDTVSKIYNSINKDLINAIGVFIETLESSGKNDFFKNHSNFSQKELSEDDYKFLIENAQNYIKNVIIKKFNIQEKSEELLGLGIKLLWSESEEELDQLLQFKKKFKEHDLHVAQINSLKERCLEGRKILCERIKKSFIHCMTNHCKLFTQNNLDTITNAWKEAGDMLDTIEELLKNLDNCLAQSGSDSLKNIEEKFVYRVTKFKTLDTQSNIIDRILAEFAEFQDGITKNTEEYRELTISEDQLIKEKVRLRQVNGDMKDIETIRKDYKSLQQDYRLSCVEEKCSKMLNEEILSRMGFYPNDTKSQVSFERFINDLKFAIAGKPSLKLQLLDKWSIALLNANQFAQ